jgi:hypothetical protein
MNGVARHSTGAHCFGDSLARIPGTAGNTAAAGEDRQRDQGTGSQAEAAAHKDDGDPADAPAAEGRAARALGLTAVFCAIFAVGYLLSLALTGCATARPRVEQALTTAGECLGEKAAQCAVVTLASCSGLPSRAEIYACVQTTYPSCVIASATMCAAGAWEGLPAATVGPGPELTP